MTSPANSPETPPATEPLTPRQGHQLLVGLTALLLLAHIGIHGWHIGAGIPPIDRVNWQIAVPIFAAFSFLHSAYLVGFKRTLTFFAVTYLITLGVELIGLTTGWPFGRYYYTEVLGAKLFGAVPWVVPLAYFMMVVPSHTIANLIVDGRPVAEGHRLWRLLLRALLTAIVMTAWDLTNDPLMAVEVKAWIWLDGGPFFGIPLQNFGGWTMTVFIISVVCRMIETKVPPRPFAAPPRWFVSGALIGYAMFMVTDTVAGYPIGTRVIAPFAMGIPLLAAFMRLYAPQQET